MTIALCDDDAQQAKNLRGLLTDWSADKPFAVTICEYESGTDFLFHYEDVPCDLLLLDIEMPGINGMELAKKLRARGDMLPIIFITGYSEYISEGYDVEALHYLLKPLDAEKLFAVLDRYVSRCGNSSEEILIPGAGMSTHVSVDSIIYIEAFGRKTQVHLADQSAHGLSVIDCSMGISRFENLKGLIRCHRSYIINLRHVRSIGKTSVLFDTGAEIPLSRRLYHEVNQMFISFYMGQKD